MVRKNESKVVFSVENSAGNSFPSCRMRFFCSSVENDVQWAAISGVGNGEWQVNYSHLCQHQGHLRESRAQRGRSFTPRLRNKNGDRKLEPRTACHYSYNSVLPSRHTDTLGASSECRLTVSLPYTSAVVECVFTRPWHFN